MDKDKKSPEELALDTQVIECFERTLAQKNNYSYATVMAFNYMI